VGETGENVGKIGRDFQVEIYRFNTLTKSDMETHFA